MPHDKKPNKKIISLAGELAANAMAARMFDAYKPEEIADFCLAAARRIIDKPIDTDVE